MEPAVFRGGKYFASRHDQFAACLRNKNETAARDLKSKSNGICLAEFGGPGL
ncbi:MAG TPA: hypothetical protein VNE84_05320 [Candidatus Limnocylindria bacterium]|nr:hypothetical protein [Candidatus Limnocylindria bacterium]